MINRRILKTGALAVAMTVVFAMFAFRAADWTKGLSSEFIVYGAATGGSTTTTPPPSAGGGASSKAVSQIAAGAYDSATHYGTVIEVVNPNTSAITVSGNFYNDDGTPSTLTFATNLSSQPTVSGSFSNLALPASSILILSTGTTAATTPASGTTNWGMITASNTISVSSFFELRHRGDEALFSRVGIASSRTDMTSFAIPRVREKQSAISGLAE